MGDKSAMAVFVLGTHHDGSSAIGHAVHLLAPQLREVSDLSSDSPQAGEGVSRSAPLTTFNDELLEHLGGSWAGPPRFDDAWSWKAEINPYRERGRTILRSACENQGWVWSDPRNCLLLPFWKQTLDVRPIVILVLRPPFEVSRALDEQTGITPFLGLALWERYIRLALGNVRGLPVLVTRFRDLLRDPVEWCDTTGRFLAANDVACHNGASFGAIGRFVDSRRSEGSSAVDDLDRDPSFSESQRQLALSLETLVGIHESFPAVEAPPETAWTESLLAERRRADIGERRRFAESHERSEEIERLRRTLDTTSAGKGARGLAERLELLENENEVLVEQAVRLGNAAATERALRSQHFRECRKEMAAREFEAQRLHGEVAQRQALLDAMRRTKLWRLRDRFRRLLGLGS